MIHQARCPHCLDRGCERCEPKGLSRRSFFFLGAILAAKPQSILDVVSEGLSPVWNGIVPVAGLDVPDCVVCSKEAYEALAELILRPSPLFVELRKRRPAKLDGGTRIQTALSYGNREGWFGNG